MGIKLVRSNLNFLELVHLTVTGDASADYKIMKTRITAINYSKFLTEPHTKITRI